MVVFRQKKHGDCGWKESQEVRRIITSSWLLPSLRTYMVKRQVTLSPPACVPSRLHAQTSPVEDY